MSEQVGQIYYSVALDTAEMVRGQKNVDRELQKTTGSLDKFQFKVSAVATGIAILAAAMATIKSAKMADEFRLLEARVNVAAGSIERGAEAMKALQGISQRTQTSLEANADVFGRLNQSILQMGGTQQDTLRLTELLGMAIKVSGASAVEAKSAMLQFGQALGSGKLAGDELRSLLENAPYLMRQLAEGIGVPVGALKKMGEEGKLTADVVVAAMGKAAGKIEADFATFPQTIGGAMQMVDDAVQRANKNFDDMTGTSAKLAGVAQGLGTVIGELADQFQDATTESDKLGRNDQVKSWAETTANILTYVADAGDGVVRTFKQVGMAIGGMAAAAAAVARGEFSQAKTIIKELQADSEALWMAQLSGEKMRQKIAKGGGVKGMGGTFSALKAAAGSDDDTKKAANKAAKEATQLATRRLAAQEYYEGLVADNKTALEKIDAQEAKALTENEKRRVADGKNAEIYARARLEIQKKFAGERTKLAQKEADDLAELEERNAQARADAAILLTTGTEQRILLIRDEAVRQAEAAYAREKISFEEMQAAKVRAAVTSDQQMRALQQQRQSFGQSTLDMKANRGGLADQENAIVGRAQMDLATAEAEARRLGLEQSQAYADQRVAIETKMQDDLAAVRNAANMTALQSSAEIFGSLLGVLKDTAGEQSGIYKAMFAASKAFAIAESIVKIQTGLADAASKPWPLNLAAMASVAAATAGIVSTIKGTSYGGGRLHGGSVGADRYYKINENNKPEMFQAANGDQFLMPNRSGQVIPADKTGAAAAMQPIVNVFNNHPTAQVSARTNKRGEVDVAINEVANQISSHTGPVWSALRGNTNVRAQL